MRLSRSLLRVALATIVTISVVAPAGAGQRTGQLAVSVQVVNACTSTSNPLETGAQACAGGTAPIAVVHEGRSVYAAGQQPQSATPVQRMQDGPGLMTVIY